ncbi:MAG: hypothetical protein WCC21_15415 [Candidatus Acidiferrales bacterium]
MNRGITVGALDVHRDGLVQAGRLPLEAFFSGIKNDFNPTNREQQAVASLAESYRDNDALTAFEG